MNESESALALQSLRAAYDLLLRERDRLRADLEEARRDRYRLNVKVAELTMDLEIVRSLLLRGGVA